MVEMLLGVLLLVVVKFCIRYNRDMSVKINSIIVPEFKGIDDVKINE